MGGDATNKKLRVPFLLGGGGGRGFESIKSLV